MAMHRFSLLNFEQVNNYFSGTSLISADTLATTCVEVTSTGQNEDSSLTLRVGCSSNTSSPAVKQARLADGLTDVSTRLGNVEAVSFTSACGYRQLDRLLLHAICLFCNLPYPYPTPSSDLEAHLLETISTSRQSIENTDGDFEFSMRIRQHIKDMYDEVLRVLSEDKSAEKSSDSSILTLKDINKLLHVYRFGLKHLQHELCGSSSIADSDSGLEDALFACLQATLTPHQAPLDAVLVHIAGSSTHHSIPGISHTVMQALERFDLYARRVSAPAASLSAASQECGPRISTNGLGSTAESLARRTQSLDNLHSSQSPHLSGTQGCTPSVKPSRRSSTSQLHSELVSPRTCSPLDLGNNSLTPVLLQASTLFAHVPVQAISRGCEVLMEDANAAGRIRVVEHVPSVGISVTPANCETSKPGERGASLNNIFWLNSTRSLPVVAVSKSKVPVNDDLLFYSELLMHYYDRNALHQAVIKHDKGGWVLCFVMPVIVTKQLCENVVAVPLETAGEAKGDQADASSCTKYSLSFFVKNYDISDDSEHQEFASISVCADSFSDDVAYYVLHIRSECGLIGATLTRCEYIPEKQLILPPSDRSQDDNTHDQLAHDAIQKNSLNARWRYVLVCVLAAFVAMIFPVALRFSCPANIMSDSQ